MTSDHYPQRSEERPKKETKGVYALISDSV